MAYGPVPVPERRVVVVLGMHRSGTSVLASVLQALGISLGDRLVPADGNNPAGYFEHTEIVRLHREFVDRMDRRWTGPKGTLPYPDRYWETEDGHATQAELRGLVQTELAHTSTIWGVKDPRMSRLVMLWRPIFEALAVRPIYVLAVRNPASVQGSVTKRDGLSPSRAQLLWLLHNLDSVRDTWRDGISVFDYDGWFSAPREHARRLQSLLGEAAGADSAKLTTEVERLIQQGLRHNHGTLEHAIPFVEETYAELLAATTSGRLSPRLLEIESELRRSTQVLDAWREVVEGTSAQAAEVTRQRGRRLAVWRADRRNGPD